MERNTVAQICEANALDRFARLFGTSKDDLGKFEDYEGCSNLVYHYEKEGQPRILRISYNPERPLKLIQSELHFVQYLAEGGVRVSIPLMSENGNFIEVLREEGIDFTAVSFLKGRGMRVPDNGYRYREGVPIQEYFYNWGKVLGQMHKLTKTYVPLNGSVHRPEWFAFKEYQGFPFAEQLPVVCQKYDQLISELRNLPKDIDSYGLIHNDFNDGNFTVDYDTGEITVFDFDDSCYFWFVYDLACAWEGGIGRAMSLSPEKRKDWMDRYMECVMEGYSSENILDNEWQSRLPLFLRVIQMQELMHFAQYLDQPDEEIQARLRFLIRCIEDDIPYLGRFTTI